MHVLSLADVNLFDTSIPMKSAERTNFDKNAPEVS